MKDRCGTLYASVWPCQLPIGHPGPHQNSEYGMAIRWEGPRAVHTHTLDRWTA